MNFHHLRRSLLNMSAAALLGVLPAATAGPATYLGIDPPDKPQPFAPPPLAGFTAALTSVTFAPGMRQVVLSAIDARADGKVAPSIYEMRQVDGKWRPPVRVPTFGDHPGGEVAFSPDGRWLYLSSDRPPGAPSRPRAFRASVSQGRLGPPEVVPLDVGTDVGVYYPRPLPNGDLLFTSRGAGSDDLFITRAGSGGFAAPQPLDGDFNSPRDDWDLIESPDGNLRIWVSAREGSLGRTDLFYSRRDSSGAWSAARNLAGTNTAALETAPALTPDGEVLFFLRREQSRERMFWVRLASIMERP